MEEKRRVGNPSAHSDAFPWWPACFREVQADCESAWSLQHRFTCRPLDGFAHL